MFETLSTYLAQATSSDIFAGGLALGIIAAFAALTRTLWQTLGAAAWRRMTISVTVDNRSPAFKFLCLWFEESDVLRRSRRMQVTQFAEDGEWRPAESSRIVMAPSEGLHWFFHDGALCILNRSIERKSRMESFSGQEGPLETMQFTLLWGSQKAVEDWIARGAEIAATRDRIGPGVHTLGRNGWHQAGDVPRRAISSIATEDDAAARLLTDARWFYESRQWYADRGVPWRRGYLLYGPPGTGKSSLIRAVASELNCDIATLDLGRKRDPCLRRYRRCVHEPRRQKRRQLFWFAQRHRRSCGTGRPRLVYDDQPPGPSRPCFDPSGEGRRAYRDGPDRRRRRKGHVRALFPRCSG